jgi:aspartate racemase
MRSENPKIIGIVGGMGPRSGVALYESILANTPASKDQDHLSVVLMSFSRDIEDRTLFLEGKAAVNPAYEIVRVIEKLTVAGATVIGIACNTSHTPDIFDLIRSKVNVLKGKPMLLNMPLEVCSYISRYCKGISRIGLMTTNGTYKSGLYRRMLEERGFEVVVPEPVFQDKVIHRMVYDPEIGIKANSTCISDEVLSLCDTALAFFKNSNAGAIILGCTELSLVLKSDEANGMSVIDSTTCLAKALIREAMADISIPCQQLQP